MQDTEYKRIAKQIICSYFSDLANSDILTVEGYAELFEIRSNDEVLLKHIKTMKFIFEQAIQEMEGNK